MSIKRSSISTPTSSAGILGITAGENLGGLKFDPRGVIIFVALFIVVVKVLHYVVD